MRWRRAAAVLAGTALAGTAGIAVMAGGAAASQVTASMAGMQSAVAAQASPPAGHWGDARQVDLSTLQPGQGPIGIDALSCASPGNCSAGGHYTDSAQHRQAFVVTEDGGTWGEPVELTSGGIPDFSSGEPLITSLTCPVADNCAVGGFYHDAAGNERPWISASINNVWDSVETIGFAGNIIPGGLKSRITSMSLCAPFAECAIGLTAPIGTSNEALVTTSLNAPAQLVPGIQQLNAGHAAEVDSVSCWSFGNCLAGGFYTDANHHAQPFIASDINSTWYQRQPYPHPPGAVAGGRRLARCDNHAMTPEGQPSSQDPPAAGVAAVADLIDRHRPASRRLRRLVAILTEQPHDLATLVRLTALPRQTVQSVLAAADHDLLCDGDAVAIQPARVPAYRERFGYDELMRTELTDPLARRLAAAAPVVAKISDLTARVPPARADLDLVPATPETVVRRALW